MWFHMKIGTAGADLRKYAGAVDKAYHDRSAFAGQRSGYEPDSDIGKPLSVLVGIGVWTDGSVCLA